MILGNIDWLDISVNLLLGVFVIVCLLMSLIILMQRPKQEGLGAAFGGGVTDQVFGARTTNVLQRATVWLGSLFFIISLTLAILKTKQNESRTLVTDAVAVEASAAIEEAPVEIEETPVIPSLTEELSVVEDEPVVVEETPSIVEEPKEAPKAEQ